jgi:metal-responsive CopG/Arc/MetJ family transcriptional regulator
LIVDYTVEYTVEVEIVQIVLDKKLLEEADKAARRTKKNRSALLRDALREHLTRLQTQAKEERDRAGYSERPQSSDEKQVWEAEAVWPAE